MIHSKPLSLGVSAALLTLAAGASRAQTLPAPSVPASPPIVDAAPEEPQVLEETVVTGRQDNLVGVADTATQGTVGAKQLRERPILRPGELLETVPGVVISQHSGEGKANQYYLRGFNLDHGTDFATFIDGMPVNMPTHAHGQGYTDLNFMIPELVQSIRFEKGAYNAENGDFASVGAAHIDYFNSLPQGTADLTGGSFRYGRVLVANSPKPSGPGRFLYALEAFHNDGPWEHGDDYRRGNGVLRYSQSMNGASFSITGMGYSGKWNSTDQIPQRAIDNGTISRFGAIDPTDGGHSSRYSLSGDFRREDKRGATIANAYVIDYRLNLFSNFTYFLDDPVNGDQFGQADKRIVTGFNASRVLNGAIGGRKTENEFGVQVRNDKIGNVGLYHTKAQEILTTTIQDHVAQTSGGIFYQNRTRWTPTFRTVAGLRADAYRFDVNANVDANSGRANDSIASPKLSLIFGPFAQTELYASAGYGFHSNDGRGTTITVDPGGSNLRPVTPLVRAKEAELGIRTARIKGVQSTLSLWYLHLDSELVFSGDAGDTEPGRPSRRAGIEFTNYYTPTPFFTVDADIATSRARFTNDPENEGRYVDGALAGVFNAGISYDKPKGVFGSLRFRYFGPRPLTTDNTVRSKATSLVYGRVGYNLRHDTRVAVDVFNLFNTKDSDIDYYYASRLPGEPAEGVNDIHLHPAESRSIRFTVSTTF